MRREAPPADRAGEAELVEVFGVVVGDTARKDLALPGICRRFKSLQLTQSFEQPTLTQQLGGWRDVLPTEQPVHELRRSAGFNLLAKFTAGRAMDSSKYAALAPFRFRAAPSGDFAGQ